MSCISANANAPSSGGTRNCSRNRPLPVVDAGLRARMGDAAVRGAKAVQYAGAGTVEFLVDASGDFWFMEMNTRIQVEHPVTEEVTGADLIELQIHSAMGEEIPEKEVPMTGHAIECRINAEDPFNNFRPSPGVVTAFHTPGGQGVRVDTHAYAGYTIPPYYDSMIAKLIVHARTRALAIRKMMRALDEFVIEGVHTTIPFQPPAYGRPLFSGGRVYDGVPRYIRSGACESGSLTFFAVFRHNGFHEIPCRPSVHERPRVDTHRG